MDITLLILGLPFFAGGVALAQVFRSFSREMPRLYMADLVGAGAGPLLAVLAMNTAGIPLAAGLFYPLTGWLLSPVFASVAMALSSVTVVSNANRLRLFKPVE